MNYEKKIPPLGESWCEYRKKHYTAEEIAENDLMVKQSVIARMESGKTDPQLSTILKLLVSMGKTLTIVPLELSEK